MSAVRPDDSFRLSQPNFGQLSSQPQTGDRVLVTRGKFKDNQGTIIKNRGMRIYKVELKNGLSLDFHTSSIQIVGRISSSNSQS
jgi:hypothetical protein